MTDVRRFDSLERTVADTARKLEERTNTLFARMATHAHDEIVGGAGGFQPADDDLTTIAGLTPTDGDLLARVSGAWAAFDPASLPVSTATQAELDGKAAASHNHSVGDIAASGTPSEATYLRGDGTWAEVDAAVPEPASFADSFDRADSTDLGPGWTVVSGSWAISGGELVLTSPSGSALLAVATEPFPTEDHEVSATLPVGGSSHGVLLRYVDADNFVAARVSGSWQAAIFECTGGANTILATAPSAWAAGDRMTLRADGDTYTLLRNGTEVASASASAGGARGYQVGVRSNGASTSPRWDDFEAVDSTAPSGGGTDHGDLTGLGDDDHPQYLNSARGDSRYSSLEHSHTAFPSLVRFNSNVILDGYLTTYEPRIKTGKPLADFAGTGSPDFKLDNNGPDYRFYWNGSDIQFVRNDTNAITKTFVIDHPDAPDRYLVHGCTESPNNGVEYWGEAQLDGGRVTVELPAYFESLCAENGRQVQVTIVADDDPGEGGEAPFEFPLDEFPPPTGPPPVYSANAGRVRDGRFTIYSDAPDGNTVSWLVKAVRQDVPALQTEPLKTDITVHGDGPYRYYTIND